jgi:hypothetical protein
MKSAKSVLEALRGDPAYKRDQHFGIFVHQISMATNGRAVLNQEQDNFLRALISEFYGEENDGLANAARIAVWINSCR